MFTIRTLAATLLFAASGAAQNGVQGNVTIDPATRTITTSNFAVTWNTGVDTEALTGLEWKGGANLAGTYQLGQCGNNIVEYFGNSWAPPDPESGGIVLVGDGTITPAGTLPWHGQILVPGAVEVTVNSNSTNCPPASAGIDVQTTYRFFDAQNAAVNWFGVERVYDFTGDPFAHDFRPYIGRLGIDAGYTEVLYPSTTGELVTANVSNCPTGCTGPRTAPGATPLNPPWAQSLGWFAIHNPATQEGVVVSRVQSLDPQGNLIQAQLWIDYDGPLGFYSNASSFLLMSPVSGFTGGLVTESETLCFYNSALWTPSLIPPLGCANAPIALFPGSLSFPGQSVGMSGAPNTALLRNLGAAGVSVTGILASGDFSQTNDCPAVIPAGGSCTVLVAFKPSAAGIRSGAVTVFDLLSSHQQTLALAGLGVAAP